MYVPSTFHHVNTCVCFVLGQLFNIWLIWLVWKKTPKEMKPYRKILILNCVIDIVYLLVYGLTMPVLIISKGYAVLFQTGFFWEIAQPYNFVLVGSIMFLQQLSIYALIVPFLYRYLAICW